jgi:hypothetical protein
VDDYRVGGGWVVMGVVFMVAFFASLGLGLSSCEPLGYGRMDQTCFSNNTCFNGLTCVKKTSDDGVCVPENPSQTALEKK